MSQLKFDKLSPSERKEYLLQVLGFDPLTISSIKSGETLLGEALSSRISEVMNNPADTTQCAIVCQNIRRDGVSYETMDATPYLEHINELKARGGKFADDEPHPVHTDSLNNASPNSYTSSTPYGQSQSNNPQYGQNQYGQNQYGQNQYGQNGTYGYGRYTGIRTVTGAIFPKPIMRYIARLLDLTICKFFINILFIFGFKVNPIGLALLSAYSAQPSSNQAFLLSMYSILSIVVFYIAESVMIHYWGTTPGKRIFGIRISNEDGSKLSWKQAIKRSALVMVFGYGLHLQFLSLFTLINSYIRCKRGMLLRWDAGIRIDYPETITRRHVIPAIVLAVFVGIVSFVCLAVGNMVPNRGEITEEQFYENCKHVVQYGNINFTDVPEYTVTTDASGHVRKISYVVESDKSTISGYSYYNQMYVAFLAFAGAQRDISLDASDSGIDLINILSNLLSDFSFNFAGLRVTNNVETVGYSRNINGDLYQSADTDIHTFRMIFTVEK